MRGSVLPFLAFALVSLIVIMVVATDYTNWKLQEDARNGNAILYADVGLTGSYGYNTTVPVNISNVVNTNCGADVMCNLGNIGLLMAYNSSYAWFTLLVLIPIGVLCGVILMFWIRGVSL